MLWTLVCLALIAGLGLGMYARYTQKVVNAWDPLAYLFAGQRIAEGEGPTLCHPFNESIGPFFTLAGFNVQVDDGACLFLNYPPAFPLLLAAAQVLTGVPDAALYVPALLGALGILITFAFGAVWFDRWVGLIAAGVLALMPVYVTASTAPWSDVAATVFGMGGLALFLWARSFPREKTRWSMAVSVVAAAALVYGISIRYINVVILLPLALLVLTSQRDGFRRKTDWLFAGVVFFGLVGILLFNQIYYGGPFTTGYSPRHGWYSWPAFSPEYALGSSPVGSQSFKAVVNTLVENLRWLLVLAVAGLVAMPRRAGLFIGALIGSFMALYGLYAFPAEGVNARFLLPVLPPLAVAVAYGLRFGWLRWGWESGKAWLWTLVGIVFLVASLLVPLPDRLETLQERNAAAARDVQIARELVEDSDPSAVFLAYGLNDPIIYSGERLGLFYRRLLPQDPVTGALQWDELETRMVEVVTELLQLGIPVYYVQDSDPPFADSRNILERHFVLEPQNTAPATFRILIEP